MAGKESCKTFLRAIIASGPDAMPVLNSKKRQIQFAVVALRGEFQETLKACLLYCEKYGRPPVSLRSMHDDFVLANPDHDQNLVHSEATIASDVEELEAEATELDKYAPAPKDFLVAASNFYKDGREKFWLDSRAMQDLIMIGGKEWRKQIGFDAAEEFRKFSASHDVKWEPAEDTGFAPHIELFGEELTADSSVSVHVTDLSMVMPRARKWLWPNKLLLEAVNNFVGCAGTGKTTILANLIARVTTGANWPDGSKNTLGARDVLLCSSEDDKETDIIPALMAAGAELKRVKWIEKVVVNNNETIEQRQLRLDKDMKAIQNGLQLEEHKNVVLLALDPLESFVGEIDANRNKDMRGFMDRLKVLAKETGIAVLGIVHTNKRAEGSALEKTSGVGALVNAARANWFFSRDVDDKSLRHMSWMKVNGSTNEKGLDYHIIGKDVEIDGKPESIGFIDWGEESEKNADEQLTDARDKNRERKGGGKIDLARAFILTQLTAGPKLASEMYRSAESSEGISAITMKRANSDLQHEGITREPFQMGRQWYWALTQKELRIAPELEIAAVM